MSARSLLRARSQPPPRSASPSRRRPRVPAPPPPSTSTPVVSIAPIGVTVNLGSTPVVTIGGTPTTGVGATVPVDGHATATGGPAGIAGRRGTRLATAAPVLAPAARCSVSRPDLGAPRRRRRRPARLCGARPPRAADAPAGCALPAGSPTPSLADALARVGSAPGSAVLASGPVTPCGAAGSDGSGTGGPAVPPSLVGIDGDTQVCAAATLLGLADPVAVPGGRPTHRDRPDRRRRRIRRHGDHRWHPIATTVDGDVDVCLGLAVLTSTDTSRCAAPASATTGNGLTAPSSAAPRAPGRCPRCWRRPPAAPGTTRARPAAPAPGLHRRRHAAPHVRGPRIRRVRPGPAPVRGATARRIAHAPEPVPCPPPVDGHRSPVARHAPPLESRSPRG